MKASRLLFFLVVPSGAKEKELYLLGVMHNIFRECVRNLDLWVQAISTSGTPWGISEEEEEGIHAIWSYKKRSYIYLRNTKGQEISKDFFS